MALEAATYLQDLDAANPSASDPKHQGDDHLRLIKAVLKATFPDATGPIRFGSTEEITTNQTVVAEDANKHYVVDPTAGNVTITLPAEDTLEDGWSIRVTKKISHANGVIINAVQPINGADTVTLQVAYETARIIWTGDVWFALDTSPFYTRAEIDTSLDVIVAALALKAAKAGQVDFITLFIEAPANKDYTLILNSPKAYVVNSITTKASSGTCTVTGKINAVTLGATANSASTSEQTRTASTANTVGVGDDLTLTISSNASCTNLQITVALTEALS